MGIRKTRFFFPSVITTLIIFGIITTQFAYAADGEVNSFQKISDIDGDFTATLSNDDFFGASVANIGDLDNDGIEDIVVGAPRDDDGGTDRGAVYILFMGIDGKVDSFQKISDTSGDFTATLDNSDLFGASVAGIGDLDGDGIEDIVVGTDSDDDGGNNRGAVYVLFLGTDGKVDGFQKISDTSGDFTATLDNSDFFGISVAGIGDLDGDGIEDIVVGTYLDDDGGASRGAVYVLFLGTDGKVDGFQKISDTSGDFTATLDDDDRFGFSVVSIGDLDDDGIEDIVVGAFNDDDGGTDRGAVYVLFLGTDGKVDGFQKISDTSGDFTATLDDDDEFGFSVAGIGDLDGDGIEDIVVGAPDDADGGTDRGAVYVLFLGTDGNVDSFQKISDTEGSFTATLDNGDVFGFSIAGLTDLDGDGIEDIVVGAGLDDDGGTNRGAVYVLFLEGTLPASSTISAQNSGNSKGCRTDCKPPTLGVDHKGTRMVDNGFSYNGYTVQVQRFNTDFPLITVQIGKINTAELIIYENRGERKLTHVGLAFGLDSNQHFADSPAIIEWDRNLSGEETISQTDPNDVIDDESLRIESSKVACKEGGTEDRCTLLKIFHKLRANLDFNIVKTSVWDSLRNGWQNTFNHGIHIEGKSMNPPVQHTVSDDRKRILITEIGKNTAIDVRGNIWIFDKSWKKEYVTYKVIDDGVTAHLYPRDHPIFDIYKMGQEVYANEIMEKLCPRCSDAPFDKIDDTFAYSFSEGIDRQNDPVLQSDIAKEIVKAEQKYHYLYDELDRLME